MTKWPPPIVQLVVGVASTVTGIAMVSDPQYGILRYISRLFGVGSLVLVWPAVLIGAGISIVLFKLGYIGYRVLAAPFVIFILFSASRLLTLGPFWWSLVILLLTLFLLMTVSRRYP